MKIVIDIPEEMIPTMTDEQLIAIIRKHECNSEHYAACETAIKALTSIGAICEAIDAEHDNFQALRIIQQICKDYQENKKWIEKLYMQKRI